MPPAGVHAGCQWCQAPTTHPTTNTILVGISLEATVQTCHWALVQSQEVTGCKGIPRLLLLNQAQSGKVQAEQTYSLLYHSFLLCFISSSSNQESVIRQCAHEGESDMTTWKLPKVHVSMMPFLNHLLYSPSMPHFPSQVPLLDTSFSLSSFSSSKQSQKQLYFHF